MKKILLLFCAIFAISAGASAQKVQVQVGYGGYTQMDGCDMHGGYGPVDNAWGALTAAVNFQVSNNLWLGGSYTFSSTSYKHDDDGHAYYHVVMLNGRYDYYRSGFLKLYGHLGIGCDITHIGFPNFSKDKGYFAFQVSPIGAEYNLSRVTNIFAELGYGAQGLLQVGFRFGI